MLPDSARREPSIATPPEADRPADGLRLPEADLPVGGDVMPASAGEPSAPPAPGPPEAASQGGDAAQLSGQPAESDAPPRRRLDDQELSVRTMMAVQYAGWEFVDEIPLSDREVLRSPRSTMTRKTLIELRELTHPITVAEARATGSVALRGELERATARIRQLEDRLDTAAAEYAAELARLQEQVGRARDRLAVAACSPTDELDLLVDAAVFAFGFRDGVLASRGT